MLINQLALWTVDTAVDTAVWKMYIYYFGIRPPATSLDRRRLDANSRCIVYILEQHLASFKHDEMELSWILHWEQVKFILFF